MAILLLLPAFFLPLIMKGQEDIISDSKEAKASFEKADPSMRNLFDKSYGYAIFPNVGKGGAGVGGAAGKGTVYEKGKTVGTAEMIQVSVGAQAGGQAYREVIFSKVRCPGPLQGK